MTFALALVAACLQPNPLDETLDRLVNFVPRFVGPAVRSSATSRQLSALQATTLLNSCPSFELLSLLTGFDALL